jgi:lipoprotein NlpD
MILSLVGCVTSDNYAPVTDIDVIEPIPKSGMHRVKRGETLYEVAWRYGLDYRTLAQHNRMREGQGLRTGKVLDLRNSMNNTITVAPAKPFSPVVERHMPSVRGWIIPTQGKLMRGFSGKNKGIDIAGVKGQPVFAAAAGKVVYCGDGLKAYGNLIIIKHNNLYLSAYAYNQSMDVHEGQPVTQGQKIAAMGQNGSNQAILHFEIRQAGKPVDPLSLLKMNP